MTITLPAEQDGILARLIAKGLYASPQEAVADALNRLENDESRGCLTPRPLTVEEAEQAYASDPEWEKVERAVAGRTRPEA